MNKISLTDKQTDFMQELASEFSISNPPKEDVELSGDTIDFRVVNGLWRKGLLKDFDRNSVTITELGANYIKRVIGIY